MQQRRSTNGLTPKMMELTKSIAISILCLISFQTSANHVVGSEITYKKVDSLQYEITLNIYRQCGGTSLANTQNITLQKGSISNSDSLTRVSISEVKLTCDTASSLCSPQNNSSGSSSGLEKHIYKDTFDFTSSLYSALVSGSGMLRVSFSVCCRSVQAGISRNHYNFLEFALGAANASPILTSDPLYQTCCNETVFYNIGAMDTSDFDSLSYSWGATFTSRSSTINPAPIDVYYPGTLQFPYYNINSNPPIGIYLNSETGDLVFTPINCTQTTSYVIEVKEWAKDSFGNRIHVGTVRRDLSFEVLSCPNNNPPRVNGPYAYAVCEGVSFCLNITSNDNVYVPPPPATSPPADTVALSWNHGIPDASFTIINPTARLQTGRFCWTPDIGTASNLPYSFAVTAKDNQCSLGGRAIRALRIIVKKRATTFTQFQKIAPGKYIINSHIDSATFQGGGSYNWAILDSASNIIFDTLKASFQSSGSFVSQLKSDTLHLKRNQTYIIKHTVNNAPYNCPQTYFDTIKVDSLFTVQVNFPKDSTVCAGSILTLNTSLEFPTGQVTYQWYKNTSQISGATSAHLQVDYSERDSSDSYTVIATDSAGHTSWHKIRIRSLDNVRHYFNLNPEFCQGDSLQLNLASTFHNIQWSNGDTTNESKFLATPQIYVSYSDSFLCTYTDTIELIVNKLPIPKLKDSAYCEDNAVLYPGVFTYYWWSNGQRYNSIDVSVGGLYIVSVADSNGCKNSDTAQIDFYHNDKVNLGQDVSKCGSYELESNIAGSYLWGTGEKTKNYFVTKSGKYTLTVIDNDGCVSTDSLQVTVKMLPMQTWGDTVSLCVDSIGTLTSDSFSRYRWANNLRTRSISVSTPGMYSLIFEDSNGCYNQDSVFVTFRQKPRQLWPDSILFCETETPIISSKQFSSYLWNTGDTSKNIIAESSGYYSLQFEADNGCENNDSIYVELFSLNESELGEDTMFCGKELLLSKSGRHSYLWSTGDTTNSIRVNSSGDLWVKVMSLNGCSNTDSIRVQLVQNTNIPILTLDNKIIYSNVSGKHVWFLNRSIMTGMTDSFITLNQTAKYSALSIDTNGCISDTSNSINYLASLGDFTLGNFKIYPNPTSGKITINTGNLDKILGVKLFDSHGALVEFVQTIHDKNIELEWTSSAGTYWLELETPNGVYRTSIVRIL